MSVVRIYIASIVLGLTLAMADSLFGMPRFISGLTSSIARCLRALPRLSKQRRTQPPGFITLPLVPATEPLIGDFQKPLAELISSPKIHPVIRTIFNAYMSRNRFQSDDILTPQRAAELLRFDTFLRASRLKTKDLTEDDNPLLEISWEAPSQPKRRFQIRQTSQGEIVGSLAADYLITRAGSLLSESQMVHLRIALQEAERQIDEMKFEPIAFWEWAITFVMRLERDGSDFNGSLAELRLALAIPKFFSSHDLRTALLNEARMVHREQLPTSFDFALQRDLKIDALVEVKSTDKFESPADLQHAISSTIDKLEKVPRHRFWWQRNDDLAGPLADWNALKFLALSVDWDFSHRIEPLGGRFFRESFPNGIYRVVEADGSGVTREVDSKSLLKKIETYLSNNSRNDLLDAIYLTSKDGIILGVFFKRKSFHFPRWMQAPIDRHFPSQQNWIFVPGSPQWEFSDDSDKTRYYMNLTEEQIRYLFDGALPR